MIHMIKTASHANKRGFTLIELLVVIGILAVLLAITLIAINPARQFGNANNTRRKNDVTQVLNSVGQFVAENQGRLPAEVAALLVDAATPLSAANFPNVCAQLVPTYIPALPTDPSLNDADNVVAADCAVAPPVWATGYTIQRDVNNRITVTAPTTDNAAVISVTR